MNPRSLVLAAVLLSPGLADASGDGGWSHVIYQAINLTLLVGLLVYFGRKPLRSFLEGRAASVEHDLAEAGRLHEAARGRLDELEAKLAQLDAEVASILDDARRAGEAEKARLVKAGEVEAERVRSEAERAATNEARRARESLEGELVDLAIEAARRMLAEQMTPDDRRRLTADYLSRLEEHGA